MIIQKRLLTRLSITVALVTLAPVAAMAGDESYSSVIKHIKSNYHAKQQGFFGAMMLARFAVKVIKPAGVKNFKLTLLRDLDYSEGPSPQSGQFHALIRNKIDPRWTPLVQYASPREKQWSYVYVTREKDDVKLLVVTLSQRDAVVLQTRFSPDKLVEFMNNPQIMGISLNNDNRSRYNHRRADEGGDDDEEDRTEKSKPPARPPQ
ncbi:MAG TPA: hypothetical protein VLM38_21875 [Blastocatellia bacterium]|nr:hypothetical protein [Blastocatellia bacterium]